MLVQMPTFKPSLPLSRLFVIGSFAALFPALYPSAWASLLNRLRLRLHRMESRALVVVARYLRRKPPSGWFDGLQQSLTSESTNSVDQDPATWKAAFIFQEQHELLLPYPPIHDDTEGIAAFDDLVRRGYIKGDELILNLGGGAFDGPARWLEAKFPATRVMTADPWRRTAEHNRAVQAGVEADGGVDIVMSVPTPARSTLLKLPSLQPLEYLLYFPQLFRRMRRCRCSM